MRWDLMPAEINAPLPPPPVSKPDTSEMIYRNIDNTNVYFKSKLFAYRLVAVM